MYAENGMFCDMNSESINEPVLLVKYDVNDFHCSECN
jgi:hypothetical protein